MRKSKPTKELVKHQKWVDNEIKTKGKCVLNEYLIAKKSKIHGIGVYALKNIKKETKVIEYVGEKIRKDETDRRSKKNYVYIFTLNKIWDVDGKVGGNGSQYINHSCNPNCETDVKKNRIWIIAFKRIKKGDEIIYDYGYDFDKDYEDHPCKCGSKGCVKYIIVSHHWKKLKKAEEKKLHKV